MDIAGILSDFRYARWMPELENDEQRKQERKAKKAERREKQRRQNILRADKMHAARLAYTEVKPVPPAKLPELNIGCSGWFYWHWRDCFYPANMKPDGWFDHYAKRFRTVELNAPFYGWPTVATVKSWLKQVGRRKFVYTVKVNELITHVRQFQDTERLVADFGWIADLLGKHMGCLLFQLPPGYHYSPERLQDILRQLEPSRRNVIEFRHISWWNEEVYSAFRETGTIFCSCSGPRLPDELIRTTDEVYIRFHGKKQWYRHNYSKEELQVWAERIRNSGAKRVWVYFNNDWECHAVRNARMLIRLLDL